ncbi:ShlB/FhaC/HecB family hemolysin secretion/activation protein [Leptolyngbya sp. AN03gr2]
MLGVTAPAVAQSPSTLPRLPSAPLEPQTPLQKPLQPTPPVPIPQPRPESLPPETTRDTIQVNQFIYEGNQQLSRSELDRITAPYRGRSITFAELAAAREAVKQAYLNRGFTAAVVRLLPNRNQNVQTGIVTLSILEGSIERIEITGDSRLERYVRSRLNTSTFNEAELLNQLRLLQVDPLIQSINVDVQSSATPGRVVLIVQIVPTPTNTLAVDADNFRPETVGNFQRRVSFAKANLLGLGDTLELGYGNTTGSNDWLVRYSLPITPQDTRLEVSFRTVGSRIITEPFRDLDIRAKTNVYELAVRHPIVRRASAQRIDLLSVGIGAEYLDSRTILLGEGFPLSAGADSDGRTRIGVINLFQNYQQINLDSALALNSTFSFGIAGTRNPEGTSGPDSRFVRWQGDATWFKRLRLGDLVVRSLIQWSDRPLVSTEQFSLGGSIVRGYRPDALLGDRGAFASAELRIPLESRRRLSVVPFLDVGAIQTVNQRGFDTLGSAGIGLQWSDANFLARLDYAFPFRQDGTLRGNDLNFSVGYRTSF